MPTPTLLILLAGCAGRNTPAPEPDPIERFRIQIQADFTTTGLENLPDSLPPESVDLLAPVGFDLDVVVRREPSQVFRDGSLGHYVRFESAEGTIRRGEVATPAVLTLAGRTVEVRTFTDGELLDVTLMEHIAGLGRYGDVFDLIFPILTPTPPDLSGQQAIPRAMHWPVRLSENEQLLNTLWAQWSMLESTSDEWHLGYAGKWAIRGAQEAGGQKVPAGGSGTGEGEIWLRHSDSRLERHTFQWQRELTLIYAPREDSVLRIKQQQVFSGALERL
ncbi:MAG: hypothetical protein ACI8RZ_001283 [Myxococcota bacterium]|jgi:hypothetical protein